MNDSAIEYFKKPFEKNVHSILGIHNQEDSNQALLFYFCQKIEEFYKSKNFKIFHTDKSKTLFELCYEQDFDFKNNLIFYSGKDISNIPYFESKLEKIPFRVIFIFDKKPKNIFFEVLELKPIKDYERKNWVEAILTLKKLKISNENFEFLLKTEPFSIPTVIEKIKKIERKEPLETEETFRSDLFVKCFFEKNKKEILKFNLEEIELLSIFGLLTWNIERMIFPNLIQSEYQKKIIFNLSKNWEKEEKYKLLSELVQIDEKIKSGNSNSKIEILNLIERFF